MGAGGSRVPAQAGIPVMVAEPGWRRLIRRPEALAARAARAAGGDCAVVLASDGAVKRLNARHRGRNKPTNVLTFDPAAPGLPGEIVLALGTVRREAAAAGQAAGGASGASGGARRAASARPRPPRRRRGAADGDGGGAAAARGSALPNPWKRA